MKILNQVPIETALQALRRPGGDGEASGAQIRERVQEILAQVRLGGDRTLVDLTRKFDGVALDSLRICDAEIEAAIAEVDQDLKAALRTARQNIEVFHKSQQESVRSEEHTSELQS